MDSGLKFTILQRNVGQKWLHVDSRGTQLQHIDLEYHLPQVSIFFTQTDGFYWTEVFPFPNA